MTTSNGQTPGASGPESRPSGEWWIDYAIHPALPESTARPVMNAKRIIQLNARDYTFTIMLTDMLSSGRPFYEKNEDVFIKYADRMWHGVVTSARQDYDMGRRCQVIAVQFESGTPSLV